MVRFQRIFLVQVAQVLEELHHVEQEKDAGQEEPDEVEQPVAAPPQFVVLFRPRRIDEQGVDENQDQAHFRGAQFAVGQPELVDDDGADVRVDGEAQVAAHEEQGDVHPHDGREADADADEAGGQRVQGVVDEEPVDGALGLAHPGQRAVQAVAVPVHRQSGRGEPEPAGVDVGQQSAGREDDGAQHAYESQEVRRDPCRLPFGQPH